MIQCNVCWWTVTVQWDRFMATASAPTWGEAKAEALEKAFKKGQAHGAVFNPQTDKWFTMKIARSGRGTTMGGTFFADL